MLISLKLFSTSTLSILKTKIRLPLTIIKSRFKHGHSVRCRHENPKRARLQIWINLKVAKENWKSDTSRTLHSCDEKNIRFDWTTRVINITIQLTSCLVISDENMSMSTSRARYFLLTLYTFSFDFLLGFWIGSLQDPALSCKFLRATQETVTCYLRITAARFTVERKKHPVSLSDDMNYLRKAALSHKFAFKIKFQVIVLRKINQSESADLSTFRGFRG